MSEPRSPIGFCLIYLASDTPDSVRHAREAQQDQLEALIGIQCEHRAVRLDAAADPSLKRVRRAVKRTLKQVVHVSFKRSHGSRASQENEQLARASRLFLEAFFPNATGAA